MRTHTKFPCIRLVLGICHGCLFAALWSISTAAAVEIPGLAEEQTKEESKESQAEKVISSEPSPEQDQKIRGRLREIFSNMEGLEGVQVGVEAGVVTLLGEAISADARERAVKLAGNVEGVVDVQNNIETVLDVERRLDTVMQRLQAGVTNTLSYLPLVTVAIIILVVFWVLASILVRWDRLYARLAPNRFIKSLMQQLVRVAVVVTGIVLALIVLDATALIGTVLGAAGLVGLAIGFAIRDTVENYIASILLSLRQPFAPMDFVLIEEYKGHVIRLTSRATVLMTPEGDHVRIPNAIVYKGVITNYTRNPSRRFSFDVGVDTEQNLVSVQQLAIEVLQKMEGVSKEPPPSVSIEALGDSNVIVRIYGWVNQRKFDYLKVKSEAIRLIKDAFDRAGIGMPEPIYNLKLAEMPVSQPLPKVSSQPKKAEVKKAITDHRGAANVGKDDHIRRQIEQEQQAADVEDLLDNAAPQE